VFVSDGYNGHRVAKFDKDGKFVWTSVKKACRAGRETRPGYFTTVHGIAADPMTQAGVRQRSLEPPYPGARRRSGKVVDWWPVGQQTNLQFLIIPADRSGVWGFTDTTSAHREVGFPGHLLYSWGMLGDFPGSFLNMHGASYRSGRQSLLCGSRQRTAAEVPSAAGREPRVPVGAPAYPTWKLAGSR
jgi:hypothetical protein